MSNASEDADGEMRYEELHDIITLVVESTDERTAVLNWLYYNVSEYNQQPVIVVLPQDAVFRRPGDLRELQQVTAHQDAQLILIIESNERLRLWARRHGFTVFSTLETCQRALSQPGAVQRATPVAQGLQARFVIEQSPVASFSGFGHTFSSEGTLGETYHSSFTGRAVGNSRRTSGLFEAPDISKPYLTSRSRITEPLVGLPAYGSTRGGVRVRDIRATAVLEPLAEAPFSTDVEFSLDILASQGEEQPQVEHVAQPSPNIDSSGHWQHILQDRLLLLLVALLLLGICGGIGCSYLLELARTAPMHSTPALLIYALQ